MDEAFFLRTGPDGFPYLVYTYFSTYLMDCTESRQTELLKFLLHLTNRGHDNRDLHALRSWSVKGLNYRPGESMPAIRSGGAKWPVVPGSPEARSIWEVASSGFIFLLVKCRLTFLPRWHRRVYISMIHQSRGWPRRGCRLVDGGGPGLPRSNGVSVGFQVSSCAGRGREDNVIHDRNHVEVLSFGA